jgi:hypothetical protein
VFIILWNDQQERRQHKSFLKYKKRGEKQERRTPLRGSVGISCPRKPENRELRGRARRRDFFQSNSSNALHKVFAALREFSMRSIRWNILYYK